MIFLNLSIEYTLACKCGLKIRGRPDDDCADLFGAAREWPSTSWNPMSLIIQVTNSLPRINLPTKFPL